jgi:hydrogenase maturation protein HypF
MAAPDPQLIVGLIIRVRGLVQGVGFRPHVWRLAREAELRGDVCNDGAGVLIRIAGLPQVLAEFERRLRMEAPPLAQIEEITCLPLSDLDSLPAGDFQIAASQSGTIVTGIVPDAATCPACLAEIHDPQARRYRYPFTNCTHCGPRLSIIRAIPYDRPNTTMTAFLLCAACQAEYSNSADRRFHAQPIACPACGPRIWLEDTAGRPDPSADAIAAAAAFLGQGRILAIKGIGGFHLACDASNPAAITELRRRKNRGDKPFAVMMADAAMAARYVTMGVSEQSLLEGASAPILLLPRSAVGAALPQELAPGQAELGVMLAYSPLHHLLLDAVARPLVMTSGNCSDEPQATTNDDARTRLGGLADGFLMHDRDIANRVDDSVVRVAAGRPRLLRLGRGYAPARLALPAGLNDIGEVLALGGDLKNSFCLTKSGKAIVSQHIGDLGEILSNADQENAIALYLRLFDAVPRAIAIDCHPDFHATRLGEAMSMAADIPLIQVQHHHAHIAAVMAENGLPNRGSPVIGVALDGFGFGDDGSAWGGEFLRATYHSADRIGRFAPVALPGGEKAMREPWRNAFAHLDKFIGWPDLNDRFADLDICRFLAGKPCATLTQMVARGINAPMASSAGRLFDAVAATLGITVAATSFEGEAAQKLESLAMQSPAGIGAYPCEILTADLVELSWRPLWDGVLSDLSRQVDRTVVARRFHNGLAVAVVEMAVRLADREGLDTVALSGGVFNNRLLLEGVIDGLSGRGLRVLSHSVIPCGDGGLSLGQATVALARREG